MPVQISINNYTQIFATFDQTNAAAEQPLIFNSMFCKSVNLIPNTL